MISKVLISKKLKSLSRETKSNIMWDKDHWSVIDPGEIVMEQQRDAKERLGVLKKSISLFGCSQFQEEQWFGSGNEKLLKRYLELKESVARMRSSKTAESLQRFMPVDQTEFDRLPDKYRKLLQQAQKLAERNRANSLKPSIVSSFAPTILAAKLACTIGMIKGFLGR